jgi:hypothetical protein
MDSSYLAPSWCGESEGAKVRHEPANFSKHKMIAQFQSRVVISISGFRPDVGFKKGSRSD